MRKSKYSKEFKDSTVQLIINNNESDVKVKRLRRELKIAKQERDIFLCLQSLWEKRQQHTSSKLANAVLL